MLELTAQDIKLHAKAPHKDDAIRFLVQEMVSDGLVDKEYEAGMLTREGQTSTFLGNGIAIPHGTPETRPLVHQTGLKVARFEEGIDWGNGQVAYTVIGIAAKSDEHLAILRQLTHIIIDDELSNRLHTSNDVNEVLSILKGESFEPPLLIDPSFVRAGFNAESLDEVQSLAASVLRSKNYCNEEQRIGLLTQEALNFGDGIWISTLLVSDQAPALSAVVLNKPIIHDNEPVNIFLSLTTTGSSHKKLFDRLLQLKRDEGLSQLTQAKSAMALVKLLKMEAIEGESIEIRLPMEHGLHARPAAHLSKLIKKINGQVWVENLDGDGGAINGESVAQLISLGGSFGNLLRFTVAQSDEPQSALSQISKGVSEGLGDPVLPLPDVSEKVAVVKASVPVPKIAALEKGAVVKGQCGAPGMAQGITRLQLKMKFEFEKSEKDTEKSTKRFQTALKSLETSIKEKLSLQTDSTKAQILEMHVELLSDPSLIESTQELIDSGLSAEWSWTESYEELARQLESNKDPLLAERAADYRDLGYQLMLELTGQAEAEFDETPHILICEEINPSQVTDFDPTIVLAIVTSLGGTTSHAAILARAAGIPLLVGCGSSILSIPNDTPVIVDCDKRFIRLVESDTELAQAKKDIDQKAADIEKAMASRFETAVTKDGRRVEVVANISSSKQIQKALEFGSEGVGLFRSEIMFMEHTSEPTHEQQVEEYSAVLDALGRDGKPFIVRTLDVGGDKPLPYLPMDAEENPFLGVRGARLSLLYPDMLRRQLKALLEAAGSDQLRIMFPMISDINEWRKLKKIYQEEAAAYPQANIELGMMIEVPSAALMADVFAPELDFFSVGTNDLTQYTTAIDRGHPLLSGQADPLSPAVLKLISMTVQAAEKYNIWVGVCGELAADPFAATILTGLGVKELSMSANAVALVKSKLRDINYPDAVALADKALLCESAAAVYNLNEYGEGNE